MNGITLLSLLKFYLLTFFATRPAMGVPRSVALEMRSMGCGCGGNPEGQMNAYVGVMYG